MSKRKISQQQQRRINDKHGQLLDSEENTGLVIAHHGVALEIETATGANINCSKRQHLGSIVPGDLVIWQQDPSTNSGVVVAIEPRKSLLSRPNPRGELQAVAANIDQMLIVIAPTPAPQVSTVDRYLIAALAQDITPVIVLNKEDLLANPDLQQQLLEFLNQYSKLDYVTLTVSAKEQQHLADLKQQLSNKTSVFVGQSGVGKSSLIQRILPALEIKIGDLTTLGKHGKHTTTTARLYHIPDSTGCIIDSPGIREFPLWRMEPLELAQCFIEFRPLLGHCKFRNCLHVNEPDCSLIAGVEDGIISASRLQSYQKILTSMREQTQR